MSLQKSLLVRVDPHERQPSFVVAAASECFGDVEEAGQIFDALHVTREPDETCGVAVRQRRGTGRATARRAAHVRHSSTHVSFEPPPCEEFTTSDPLRNATRVRPPGKTQVFLPVTAKGRRST